MKRYLKFLFTLILTFFSINNATAYDFEVDGIFYNIISLSDLTCKVTYEKQVYVSYQTYKYESNYSGNIVIPSKVTYNNKELSVLEIGQNAFCQCSKILSVTIPTGITSIDSESFALCSSLKSVEIPNSVKMICSDAFHGCTSLTSINIPESVTSIWSGAFEDCSSLTNIIIPNSVKSIDKPFRGCKALNSLEISKWPISNNHGLGLKDLYIKELILGKNVSESPDEIEYAEYLEKIICKATTPPTRLSCTNKQYINVEVKVPKGCLEAYQNAKGWKNFWNMSEMEDGESGVESVIADEAKTETGRYNLQGHKVGEDYRGMVIIKYSDGSTKKILNN